MQKREWYLDKITSQIPGYLEKRKVREEIGGHLDDHVEELIDDGMTEDEAYMTAIEEMGDADELAATMSEIHAYDTAGAYRRAILVLWLGFFLKTFRFGPGIIIAGTNTIQWICQLCGIFLFFVALFRLKELNHSMKKSLMWAVISMIADYLIYAAAAMMWHLAREIGIGLLIILSQASDIAMVYHFTNGLQPLANERGEKSLFAYFVMTIIMRGMWILIVVYLLLTGNSVQKADITVISASGIFGMVCFAVIVIGYITVVVFSWKLKNVLQENEDTGIRPCRKREILAWISGAIIILLIPLAVSSATALFPAKTSKYQSVSETAPEAWGRVRQLIEQGARETGSAQAGGFTQSEKISEAKLQETLELLSRWLPEEEAVVLQNADEIMLKISAYEKGWDVIWLAARISGDDMERYKISCLTCLPSSVSGYTAVSSIWTIPEVRYIENDGEDNAGGNEPKSLPEPLMAVQDSCRHWVFYEINDNLFRTYSREYMQSDIYAFAMNTVEYSLRRHADNVYCYQTMTFEHPQNQANTQIEFKIGYELAKQKSLLRLPYDQITYHDVLQAHQYPYNYVVTSPAPNSGILFQCGMVQNKDTSVWTQKGYLERIISVMPGK